MCMTVDLLSEQRDLKVLYFQEGYAFLNRHLSPLSDEKK